jgi:hypothetical protein
MHRAIVLDQHAHLLLARQLHDLQPEPALAKARFPRRERLLHDELDRRDVHCAQRRHDDRLVTLRLLALRFHHCDHVQQRELGARGLAGAGRRAHERAVAAAEERAEHLHGRAAL